MVRKVEVERRFQVVSTPSGSLPVKDVYTLHYVYFNEFERVRIHQRGFQQKLDCCNFRNSRAFFDVKENIAELVRVKEHHELPLDFALNAFELKDYPQLHKSRKEVLIDGDIWCIDYLNDDLEPSFAEFEKIGKENIPYVTAISKPTFLGDEITYSMNWTSYEIAKRLEDNHE